MMSNSDSTESKSSNCVINIDYTTHEEKLSFEVFRSSINSDCLLKRQVYLKKSNSCTQLDSYQTIKYGKDNKMIQTEGFELLSSILRPDNLGPPFIKTPLAKSLRENPVKDLTALIYHKESYAVSNFKFPEQTPATRTENGNFCSLDFDGTRSKKRNRWLQRAKNKSPKSNNVSVQCECNQTTTTTTNLRRKDRMAFELILTPNNPIRHHNKRKARKIIVTSNTLQLAPKAKVKDAQQQTNIGDFLKLGNRSVDEIFTKPNFTAQCSEASTEVFTKSVKRKRRQRNLTITVFPCIEIRQSPSSLDVHSTKKRPTIPRRRLLNYELENAQLVASTPDKEHRQLKEKVSDLFLNNGDVCLTKNAEYNKKIDELCQLINSLIQDRKNKLMTSEEIVEEKKDFEVEKQRRLHNEKEQVTTEGMDDVKSPTISVQNVKRNKMSKCTYNPLNIMPDPRNFEIVHNEKEQVTIEGMVDVKSPTISVQNVKKNKMSKCTYNPLNIMPDPRNFEIVHNEKEQVTIEGMVDVKSPTISVQNEKIVKKNKMSKCTYNPLNIMPDPQKRLERKTFTTEYRGSKRVALEKVNHEELLQTEAITRKSFTSVTFKSQIDIVGENENISLEKSQTIFPAALQRSKTLPDKKAFAGKKEVSIEKHVTLTKSLSQYDIPSAKNKLKLATVRKAENDKKEFVSNSTFLFTNKQLPTKNSCFQKRKEYYNNLKMKMKNKMDNDSSVKTGQESPANNDGIEPCAIAVCRKKSKIPVRIPSNTTCASSRLISPESFRLRKRDDSSSLFPYEFCSTCSIQKNTDLSSSMDDSCCSSRTPIDVKKEISSFMKSFPLEIQPSNKSINNEEAKLNQVDFSSSTVNQQKPIKTDKKKSPRTYSSQYLSKIEKCRNKSEMETSPTKKSKFPIRAIDKNQWIGNACSSFPDNKYNRQEEQLSRRLRQTKSLTYVAPKRVHSRRVAKKISFDQNVNIGQFNPSVQIKINEIIAGMNGQCQVVATTAKNYSLFQSGDFNSEPNFTFPTIPSFMLFTNNNWDKNDVFLNCLSNLIHLSSPVEKDSHLISKCNVTNKSQTIIFDKVSDSSSKLNFAANKSNCKKKSVINFFRNGLRKIVSRKRKK